jgi:hypothetical protein
MSRLNVRRRDIPVPASVYYTNVRGLSDLTTCQVTVRAANRVGHSGWSKVSTIHKQA